MFFSFTFYALRGGGSKYNHKTNKNSECLVISAHPSAKHGYNFSAQAPMVEVWTALAFLVLYFVCFCFAWGESMEIRLG